MSTQISGLILAIVTTDPNKVSGGGCPVFHVSSQEEQEKVCLLLSRILGGVIHDLENGVYFIFRH